MKSFTVFDEHGEVYCTGSCQAEMVEAQANSTGHISVEGSYAQDTHYYESGVVKNKPPKPDSECTYDRRAQRWVPIVKSGAELSLEIKSRRLSLLFQSDWTQLPDVPLAARDAWASYRQALRDITTQPGFPLNIVWPTPPV